MIKRQVLTTVEVLSKPIAGKKLTHFVTGYVHKPYPPVYADLAREAGFDTACIVRGVEGGVIPSLRQTGKYFHYHDKGEEIEAAVDPVAMGISQPVRAVPLPGSWPPKRARTRSSPPSTSRPPRTPRPKPASWR
jgi:anthranilate phosphoribosyltransferase